eukprot:gene40366-54593_t
MLQPADAAAEPMRIATVHRSRMTALSRNGSVRLVLPVHTNTGDFAVGDWVMVDPLTRLMQRRLARRTALLRRMARHATRYGAQIVQATATRLERDGDGFRVTTSTGALTARSVLLATGVHNRRPDIADDDH